MNIYICVCVCVCVCVSIPIIVLRANIVENPFKHYLNKFIDRTLPGTTTQGQSGPELQDLSFIT